MPSICFRCLHINFQSVNSTFASAELIQAISQPVMLQKKLSTTPPEKSFFLKPYYTFSKSVSRGFFEGRLQYTVHRTIRLSFSSLCSPAGQ